MNANNNTDKPELHLNVRDGRSPYKYVTVDGQLMREHRHVMEQVLGRKLKPNEVVHHKDGNKKNNSPDNLEVLEWSEHSMEHYYQRKPNKATSISIACYALDGTLVKEYASYAEAKADGHFHKDIRDCINGKRPTYHDMTWVHTGALTQLDRNHAINQVDPKTGKVVAHFNSLTEAGKTTGHRLWDINKCCKGQLVTHDGYFWVYVDDPEAVAKKLEAYSHLGQKPKRPIDVYDAYTGDYLESYEQIADAVRADPTLNKATIFAVCTHNGSSKSYKQKMWRFKDDPTPVQPVKQLLVAYDKQTGQIYKIYRKTIDAQRLDGFGSGAALEAAKQHKAYKGYIWDLKYAYELPDDFRCYLAESAPSSVGPARNNRVILQSDANTGTPIAVYARITDAVEQTGLDRTSIGSCCRGDRKDYSGFTWTYIEPASIPVELDASAIYLKDQKSS